MARQSKTLPSAQRPARRPAQGPARGPGAEGPGVTERSADERTRRRFARRQWARRWVTWRYLLVAVVVAAALAGGVYIVYFSDALAVEGVRVVGADTLSESEVAAAADVPTGGPLASADLLAVERRVASLAVVGDVEVTRSWPHHVRIEIRERTPVAVIDRGGRLRAVDADGVVFGSYRRPPAGLPRIETADDAGSAALEEAAAVVAAMPDQVARMVDHLELASVDEIDLALRDGRRVEWGSAEASAAKGKVLLALLQRDAQVYDVSIPGRPTISG